MMILHRRILVYILKQSYLGVSTSKKDVADKLSAKVWPWINYKYLDFLHCGLSADREQFKRFIEGCIDDFEGYKYIEYEGENGDTIKLTHKGRDIIFSSLGFIEEYLRTRQRTLVIVGLALFTSLLAILYKIIN